MVQWYWTKKIFKSRPLVKKMNSFTILNSNEIDALAPEIGTEESAVIIFKSYLSFVSIWDFFHENWQFTG